MLLLGSSHTLLNLIGAIGTLLGGSGIRNILQSAYGENAVKCENNVLFDQLIKGFRVIRQSNQYWADIDSDRTIEKTHIWSSLRVVWWPLVSEHQRALWIMFMPVTCDYNEAMQSFSNQMYTISEEHTEETESITGRDKKKTFKKSHPILYCEQQPLHNIVIRHDVRQFRFRECHC